MLPLLGRASSFEHVSVLFDGKPADMFVDELGALDLTTRPQLPANVEATEIYHTASRRRDPGADTSRWPHIHGTAVVFGRRVWS